ncbi:MAG: DUF952 domain-containing protein, partial [Maricaulaceae bacterium]
MNESTVYRLIARDAWESAWADPAGVVPWSADDERDGYLHLSTRSQVAETARRHYAGVADLWVLAFDAAVLGEALKWEPSRGGDLFPHYYGDIALSRVTDVGPFDPD